MENESGTLLIDRPETEPYHTNGRGEKPVIPIPTQRRFQPGFRKHVPPTKWALAFEQYVNGSLASLEEVASFLGINPRSVLKRAATESWTNARENRARAMREKVEQGPGLALQIGKEELSELGRLQATLAKSLLAHGPAMLARLIHATDDLGLNQSRLADLTPMSPAMPCVIQRIEALTKLSESLLEQVRVLAGLPEPGRMSAKPSTSTSTAPVQSHDPSSFQPVGLADEGGGGGS